MGFPTKGAEHIYWKPESEDTTYQLCLLGSETLAVAWSSFKAWFSDSAAQGNHHELQKIPMSVVPPRDSDLVARDRGMVDVSRWLEHPMYGWGDTQIPRDKQNYGGCQLGSGCRRGGPQGIREEEKSWKSRSLISRWLGLSRWRSGWESACQCRGHGFEPWSGKIPHAAEQLSPCATTTEPASHNFWSLHA